MARLPTVGGDAESWGSLLNEYLQTSHNSDGTLKLDVKTIADLKAIDVTTLRDKQQALVAGYTEPGDGGGGQFYYDAAASAAGNGGTVIAPTSGSGRWLRAYSGAVNVRWFGAKGDGVTDDGPAIAAALVAGDVVTIPNTGTTKLSSAVVVGTTKRLVGEGSNITVHTGGLIQLSGAGAYLGGLRIAAAADFSGVAVQVKGYSLFSDRQRPAIRDCSFRGNTGEATALELLSDTPSQNLAFVVLDSLSFRGWQYGILLRANTASGMSYVNSTLATNIYFNGLTTHCIWLQEDGAGGSEEVSGNSFANVHFQADATMQRAIKLVGTKVRGNMFQNVHIWDVTTAGAQPVVDINNGNSNYICGLMGSQGAHWSVSEYNVAVSLRDADNDTYRMELQLGKRRIRGPSDSPGVINTSSGVTEPAVTNVGILRFTNTAATSITRLTVGSGFVGRRLLVRGDGFTTLAPTESGAGRLHSSIGSLLLSANTFYEFIWDGTYWYRIS